MRVSGSICGDGTHQLQARRSSREADPLARPRAWHNCSVAASPPQVQLMSFPADSSSVVGTREALEHPVGWTSAPSASVLGGHTLASRQTALRRVVSCGWSAAAVARRTLAGDASPARGAVAEGAAGWLARVVAVQHAAVEAERVAYSQGVGTRALCSKAHQFLTT